MMLNGWFIEKVTLIMGFIKFLKMLMFCSGAPVFEKLRDEQLFGSQFIYD